MNPSNRIAIANTQSSRFSLAAPPRQSSSEHEYHLYEPVDQEDLNPILSRHLSLLEPKTSILRQLIETESNYVRALNIILTKFRDPLKGREEFQSIFQHVEYFHNLHSSFHACISKKAGLNFNDSKTEIATCFLRYREKFTRYGCYCVTIFQAQSLLEARNDELLERCQREAEFKLRDLLFLPIQRILKYPLLLAQIIEKTTNRDDYQNLKRAQEVMVDLCHHLNEIKRDTETIQIINEIEQSITGLTTQLTDYGRLLKDGKVKLKVGRDSDVCKVYVFVFDRALLICKLNIIGYQLKESLNLRDYDLQYTTGINDMIGGSHCSPVLATSKTEKWSHNFHLIRLSDGTKYNLYTKSAESRTKWINAILEAKANLRPQSNHDFVKCIFDVTSYCDNCKKILHGMFFQGYRCRNCSISVHKECIALHRACRSAAAGSLDSPTNSSDEMYVNFKLSYYPWFCGRMGREQAQSILENTPDGTFLVRVSPKHNCSYVISLNHSSKVNHMRIFVSDDNRLYLSENRYFKSVVELVSWYENNSLVESFQMLDARLETPIYRKQ